jgi:hypothetical protein
MSEHPTSEELRHFSEMTADRETTRKIVRHLIGGCPNCAREVHGIVFSRRPDQNLEEALDGVLKRLASTVKTMDRSSS